MNVLAVIPARYASTRLPGKPLAPIAGKPMIQHVCERVQQAERVNRVVVATDDSRIVEVVRDFGGEAVMTRSDHRSGSERVAEVAVQIPADIYVNVQGDEPLIEPAAVDALVEAMTSDDEEESVLVGTLCVPISNPADIMDPNIVKVALDFQGDALYFSRAPIPWVRDEAHRVHARHLKHLGIYAYRRAPLLEFPTLPPGELEKLEQLEQLRFLENGYKIRVAETSFDSVSVDVPGDLARVEALLSAR
ncbi:MAG TPA: 3-deoxy-manno-octulosonate cytidylyltransferase [Candidatus Acidoferrales bacterium]|nr:3-deoxy-manno-octulosonate cytidylyltransferase [Candidatus Acidoferrales bacterium]